MAKPSEKSVVYKNRVKGMQWDDLLKLWDQIASGATPEWDDGKALEYMIVRGFELDNLDVEYPYDVPPSGNPLEQIDGLVYAGDVVYLIECKDTYCRHGSNCKTAKSAASTP